MDVPKSIKKWPLLDFAPLMEHVSRNWDHGHCRCVGGRWELSTGGSRDNELIIEALKKKNKTAWWKLFCQEEREGGHYIFSSKWNEISKG